MPPLAYWRRLASAERQWTSQETQQRFAGFAPNLIPRLVAPPQQCSSPSWGLQPELPRCCLAADETRISAAAQAAVAAAWPASHSHRANQLEKGTLSRKREIHRSAPSADKTWRHGRFH